MPQNDIEERKEYNKKYYEANKLKNKCEHGRRRTVCKECGGGSICEHIKIRNQCKECGGGSIWEHGRQKNRCKECGGGSICEHGRQKNRCKECGGGSICEHSKVRSRCKECGGGSICEHNRIKSTCKDCGGSSICEHNRIKSQCKECGGGSICEHDRIKSVCKECGGGSICGHSKIRSKCKECGGGSICGHSKIRHQCKECNFNFCLVGLQGNHLKRCLKNSNLEKTKPSIEYLGCDIIYFKNYIEIKMVDGMTWDNIHLDHIKPINAFNLDDHDEFLNCCHYSNFQPLLAADNLSKNSKWNETDNIFWLENITGKEYKPLYKPK